jgi:hypothetical protein
MMSMDPVTLLMVLIYLAAGVICIQRPALPLRWIGNALKRTDGGKEPRRLQGRVLIWVVRIVGFFALLNAITLFYSAYYRR